MANVKITDLAALTNPASTDVLPIVDVGADVTKKVSIADLLENAGSGTASAPGIAFDGDSNTGIYRPGADQLAISTNGTGRLFIDANGIAKFIGNTEALLPTDGFSQINIQNDNASSNYAGINFRLVDDGSFSGLSLERHAGSISLLRDGTWVENSGSYPAHLLFATRGSSGGQQERLRITSDGKVGLGTSSPDQKLVINNGSYSANIVRINPEDGNKEFLIFGVESGVSRIRAGGAGSFSNELVFETAVSGTEGERARIDSDGKLLVGTSTSIDNSLEGAIQVVGGGADSCVSLTRYNSSATGSPILVIGRSKSNTKGANVIVADDDSLGRVNFTGADGSGFIVAAQIAAEVDGTPGANDMPGRLVFSTTADGASSPTERMRIGNDGDVLIGTTTIFNQNASTGSGARFGNTGQQFLIADGAPALFIGRNTSDGDSVDFRRAGVKVGSISVTASATAYNTSSDYRLKENVVPLTGAVDRLNQLQVHRFNFIADPDTTVDGFIAHEAQAVVPECVTGTKDEIDDEGNPVYQGVDQSKIVPLVVAALKEALAEIETLKTRLADAGIS